MILYALKRLPPTVYIVPFDGAKLDLKPVIKIMK